MVGREWVGRTVLARKGGDRVVDRREVLIIIGRGRVVVGREWVGRAVLARKGGGRVLDGCDEECGGRLCIDVDD